MINLLPAEDKTINKKDYLSRLFVVVGILFFIIVTIAFVLFLPVFFSLFFEKKDLAIQLNVIKQGDSSVEAEKIYADLDVLNTKLFLYEKNNDEVRQVSTLMEKIISFKTDGISLSYFKYEKDKNGKIVIMGKSASRSEFVNFKKKLEDDKSFSAVSSPLSNLLKETDINFTITIEL